MHVQIASRSARESSFATQSDGSQEAIAVVARRRFEPRGRVRREPLSLRRATDRVERALRACISFAAANVLRNFVGAVLLAGAVVHLYRATEGLSGFPGDLTDPRFNQVVLEHLWRWIRGEEPHLFSPGFFYPFPGVLAFSDNHFGSGIVYLVGRSLGASRELSFDFWFLVGYFVTFVATAFTLRKFGLSPTATAVGAFLFAFSLPMLAQEDRAQFVYRFAIPLAVLEMANLVAYRRLRDLFGLSIWTAWQFLCSIYLGVFLVLLLTALAAVALIKPDAFPVPTDSATGRVRPPSAFSTFAIGVAAAAFVALVSFTLYEYADIAHLYRFERSYSEIEPWLPRPASYLLQEQSPYYAWLAGWLPSPPKRWEDQLFPGAGAVALAVLGWRSRRLGDAQRRAALTLVVALAALIALTLDAFDFSFYEALAPLPGLNAIRGVGRINLVLAFPIAWLAALGVASLEGAKTRFRRYALAWLAVFLAFEVGSFHGDHTAMATSRNRIAELARGLDLPDLARNGNVLLRVEDHPTLKTEIDTMLLSQEAGIPTFDGYSGIDPPAYRDYHPRSCAEASQWLANIANSGTPALALPSYSELARRAIVVPLGRCGDLTRLGPAPD
jgi:hypothetical protein